MARSQDKRNLLFPIDGIDPAGIRSNNSDRSVRVMEIYVQSRKLVPEDCRFSSKHEPAKLVYSCSAIAAPAAGATWAQQHGISIEGFDGSFFGRIRFVGESQPFLVNVT